MADPQPETLVALADRVGHVFQQTDLLRQALTHPSRVPGFPPLDGHNQRLEFLGDAVLQLTLSQALFLRFPIADEGQLSKARARLVNEAALAAQARGLGLGPCLFLGTGEENQGGRDRPSILADAFEAVLGALYLDGGYVVARAFVETHFLLEEDDIDQGPGVEGNPKGELQELLQARFTEGPDYTLVATEGPDHNRSFECAVRFRGEEIGRGTGRSKKTAQSDAALQALELLRTRPPRWFQP